MGGYIKLYLTECEGLDWIQSSVLSTFYSAKQVDAPVHNCDTGVSLLYKS
jgi:hypothetical protein